MSEAMTLVTLSGFSLAGLGMTLVAGLKGWNGWLELKRLELAGQRETKSPAMERIEMADLKERIRKLESIAACVDL